MKQIFPFEDMRGHNFMEALEGFKTKFGYWPIEIEADAATIYDLLTEVLIPPVAFVALSKLRFVKSAEPVYLAKGRNGDIFDLIADNWSTYSDHDHSASDWLGSTRMFNKSERPNFGKTISGAGGNLDRLVLTIEAFKVKFGYWPTKIEMDGGAIGTLATHHLTPLGFFLLRSKVEIDLDWTGTDFLRALGREDHALSYDKVDCWTMTLDCKENAFAWLGWDY